MLEFRALSATDVAVAIVIVLILLLVFLLKDFIESSNKNKKKFFDDIIEEPNMLGGGLSELPEEILKLVNVRWPQVSVISNAILSETPLSSFHYSEKTDGEHKNLLIYKSKIYDVTHFDTIRFVADVPTFTETIVLDTELYNEHFYIFDVYYADGEVLSGNFLERMSKASEKLEQLGPLFKLKTFKPIPSIEFLIDYIKQDKIEQDGAEVEIDGVILQRIDLPYLPSGKGRGKQYTVYKMKPRHLMTVDLRLRYDAKNDEYELYTIGSYLDFLSSLTNKPKTAKMIYDAEGNGKLRSRLARLPDNLLILFDSPFIPNLSTYKVNRNWNTNSYFKRIIDQANALIADFDKYKGSYDGKIVEMSLTADNKWVPLRVRDDKRTPNGFRVAQDVISLVFDPIKSVDEIYFQKDIAADSETQTFVHKLNGVFRKYIVEQHINPALKDIRIPTVIDLCGGRGGDELNLYANGATNFFAIDADTTALKQYVDRSYYLKGKLKQYEFMSIKSRLPSKPPNFNLNVLCHMLGGDYKPIVDDLKSRYEWRGAADAVLMNYAIHYICDKPANVVKLAKFIKEVLNKDEGAHPVFVFTFFDGDAIIEASKANDGKVAKIGPFSIEIVKKTTTYAIAKMPLVTIQGGKDMYRPEPLALRKTLDGINSVLKLVDEYPLYAKTKTWADKVVAVNEPSTPKRLGFKEVATDNPLLDYYKLIKVRVYTL